MVTQLKYLKTGDKFQTGYSDIIFTYYETVLIEYKYHFKYKDNRLNIFSSTNGDLEVSVL